MNAAHEKPVTVWDQFDMIGVLAYAPNAKTRLKPLAKELRRVGLYDSVTMFYNARTRFTEVIERNVAHNRMMSNLGYLNATLGHLRMVKTALDLGCRHALFLEDDVRFRDNVQFVRDILDELPPHYDVALLDWFPRSKATDAEIAEFLDDEKFVGFWVPVMNARSCAAYAMSRPAMEYYVALVEGAVNGVSKLKICDQYWPDMAAAPLNCYAARPNVCVQGVPGGTTDYEHMWKLYSKIGIERNRYAD